MTPQTSNQGQGAMDLIMQLEEKVRGKNERIKELEDRVTLYQLEMTVKSIHFWLGIIGGTGVALVVDNLIRWVL